MADIRVPTLPESVSDATVVRWHKKIGARLAQDEALVDLETDKVILEVVSPGAGILQAIHMPEGSVVKEKDLLGVLNIETAEHAKQEAKGEADGALSNQISVESSSNSNQDPNQNKQALPASQTKEPSLPQSNTDVLMSLTPSARRQASEKGLDAVRQAWSDTVASSSEDRPMRRVTMTRIREKIAERLLYSKQSTAMLTTFNEVNLGYLMKVREQYRELFEKKHGVRLGWMSFFVQAVVEALKRYPEVNASIEGKQIEYHGFFDIGIAISTERGLVVPILRHADLLSIAEIEAHIVDYAKKAKQGQLKLDDMTGGTFTITNGGVFGSLLSTPIINPPQSAILGMHKIQERPVVEKGEIVIRPMMYIALSYDHRLIDGEQSVRFLASVKDFLEDPMRVFLGL